MKILIEISISVCARARVCVCMCVRAHIFENNVWDLQCSKKKKAPKLYCSKDIMFKVDFEVKVCHTTCLKTNHLTLI